MQKKSYIPPAMEVLIIRAEQGFAQSNYTNTVPGYGETEETEDQ